MSVGACGDTAAGGDCRGWSNCYPVRGRQQEAKGEGGPEGSGKKIITFYQPAISCRGHWRTLASDVRGGLLLAHTFVFESDLTERVSGGFPGLMASGLSSEHADWNSGLTTSLGSPLRHYANKTSP